MLCSDCFSDYGLKKTIIEYSVDDNEICPNCFSSSGFKVTTENIKIIMGSFFRNGSVTPGYLIPLFQITEYNSVYEHNLDYELTEEIINDLELIQKFFGLTIATPYINMRRGWGDTLLRCSLEENFNKGNQNNNILNDRLREILDYLINSLTKHYINENQLLFRIRKNPKSPHLEIEYDSRDINALTDSNGRFDNGKYSLFYCCETPSTCVYESKFEPTDLLILATYETNKTLTVIDLEKIDELYLNSLSADLKEIFNESDILVFINAIIRNNADYGFTQLISNRIFERKFDGIKYTSFYNRFRKDTYSNIAIFGQPLKEGQLTLKSLNRIALNEVDFKWTYGPALD